MVKAPWKSRTMHGNLDSPKRQPRNGNGLSSRPGPEQAGSERRLTVMPRRRGLVIDLVVVTSPLLAGCAKQAPTGDETGYYLRFPESVSAANDPNEPGLRSRRLSRALPSELTIPWRSKSARRSPHHRGELEFVEQRIHKCLGRDGAYEVSSATTVRRRGPASHAARRRAARPTLSAACRPP